MTKVLLRATVFIVSFGLSIYNLDYKKNSIGCLYSTKMHREQIDSASQVFYSHISV